MARIRALVRRSPLAFRLSVLLSLSLGAAELVPAQQIPEGWFASVDPLAAQVSLVLETPSGKVTFDGTTVVLTPTGQPATVLLQLPSFVYGSFLVQAGPGHVLFGHTGSLDAIWSLPLQGSPPTQPLAIVPLNYDAVMLTPTSALVSARTGGWGVIDNDLLVLDLLTGITQLVVRAPGASGPLAIAQSGDVYYATGYAGIPMPPGTTSVLRFRRPRFDLAFQTHRVLGLAHAETVVSGLDSAGDLAFDDDGDLLFVDWFNSRIGEISDAVGASPWLAAPLADYGLASVFPTTLQFVPGNGGGVFEPFQHANGALLVHETDYAAISRARWLRAAAADLSASAGSPIPSGPFVLTTANGPNLGLGIVAFAFDSTPGTFTLQVPGFEQPLLWSHALATAPMLATIPFDASGAAALALFNPGSTPASAATAQVAFVSAAGVLGATAPIALLLGP
jgi:hypothetical protein